MRDRKTWTDHASLGELARVWLENLFSTRRMDMEAARGTPLLHAQTDAHTRLLRVAAQRKLLLTKCCEAAVLVRR